MGNFCIAGVPFTGAKVALDYSNIAGGTTDPATAYPCQGRAARFWQIQLGDAGGVLLSNRMPMRPGNGGRT